MHAAYEVLRWINVALYGAVLSGLIMHWRHLLDSVPQGRWWLWGLIAVGMYGTVEVVFMGQPGGPRVIAMTVMLVGLTQALYLPVVRDLLRRSQPSDVS